MAADETDQVAIQVDELETQTQITVLASEDLSRQEIAHVVISALTEWAAKGHVGLELDDTEDSAAEENIPIDEDFVDDPNAVTDKPSDRKVELIEEVYVNDVTFDEHGRPVLSGLSGKPEAILRLLKEMSVPPLKLNEQTPGAPELTPKHDPMQGWVTDLLGWAEAYDKNSRRMLDMLNDMLKNMSGA